MAPQMKRRAPVAVDAELLQLHSQLEVVPLLEQFTVWAATTVEFATMHYRHPVFGLFEFPYCSADGQDTAVCMHTIEALGEFHFLRGQPFTPEEQQTLARHLDSLRHPLDNALRYHQAIRQCESLERQLSLSGPAQGVDHDYYPMADEQALNQALHHALCSDALSVLYQPKVDMRSGALVGLEALLRWHHAEYGLQSPEQFIPLAERHGLIGEITRWVLNTVVRQCGQWQQEGCLVPVAVNLSGLDLEDNELPAYLAQLLEAWEVPAQFLELEITETAAIGDQQRGIEILRKLSSLGVAVAIDDFGVGYSSLQRLKQLPVDVIKIDKSFVMTQGRSDSDTLFVDAIIRLGHQLGMKVIAEGVDSHESWQRLRTTGCDMAQGYHISRPLSGKAIAGWLQSSMTKPASQQLH